RGVALVGERELHLVRVVEHHEVDVGGGGGGGEGRAARTVAVDGVRAQVAAPLDGAAQASRVGSAQRTGPGERDEADRRQAVERVVAAQRALVVVAEGPLERV